MLPTQLTPELMALFLADRRAGDPTATFARNGQRSKRTPREGPSMPASGPPRRQTQAGVVSTVAVATAVVTIDQSVKGALSVTGGAPGMVPLHNPGLSLGIVSAGRWAETIAMAVALLVAVALLLPLVRRGRLPGSCAGMLLGGAFGNLIDRAVLGSVRDYLPVGAIVLNLADVAVLAGVTGALLAPLARRPGTRDRCRHLVDCLGPEGR